MVIKYIKNITQFLKLQNTHDILAVRFIIMLDEDNKIYTTEICIQRTLYYVPKCIINYD